MLDMNLIILAYDSSLGKRKADLSLCKKDELKIDVRKICDIVFPDVSSDDVRGK
jgi:hypothetical protein